MSAPFVRVRPRPRISVNKLGEYLAENKAARRLAILQDQKKELRCRVVQYDQARRAIVASLTGPEAAAGALARRLEALKGWAPAGGDTEFDLREHRLCCEAIAAFLEVMPTLGLDGLVASRGGNDAPKLSKSGVAISVRPELVVRGVAARGRPVVGAVKLHFPKSTPLCRGAGEYVGVILHEFGQLHLAGPETCDPRLCRVVDVSTKQMYVAPTSYQRRRSDVEAACREIATLWGSIGEV